MIQQRDRPGHSTAIHGWAQSNEIDPNDPNGSVSLLVQFPVGNVYTVQFAVLNPLKADQPISIEATIKWSTQGNFTSRRVSVVNGTSISGVAEAVTVNAKNQVIGFTSPGDPKYTLSILCTPGLRPAYSNPPILEKFNAANSIVGIGFVDVPIPQDAGATSVFVTAASVVGAAPARDEILVQQSNPAVLGLRVYDPREEPTFVPIVPGATSITIFNRNAGATVKWAVSFGIDG